MKEKILNSIIPFFFMFIVYLLVMGGYYYQSKSLLIHSLETEIQNILITHNAINKFVSSVQKPKIYELKEKGLLDKSFFSPVFLSSTYANMQLNAYANEEREEEFKTPIIIKYASLNPTNIKNKANKFEAQLLHKFEKKHIEYYQDVVEINNTQYLYYAEAGHIIEQKCLQCHGEPKDAPSMMLQRYGEENGFGWRVGALSSVLSVKIPLEDALDVHQEEFIVIAIIVFILFIFFFIISQILTQYIQKSKFIAKKSKLLQKEVQKYSKLVAKSKTNTSGIIIEVSDAFCQLSGYSRGELIGHSHSILRHPETTDEFFARLWNIISQGKQFTAEIKNKKKDGTSFWVKQIITPLVNAHKEILAYESIVEDITEIKQLEADSLTDPLTSLYNRRGLESIFEREYQRSRREDYYFAFMMIDIDFFKFYNDTYGHNMGDIILVDIAQEIKSCFRRTHDYVFRVGGEEFGIVLTDKDSEDITNTAQKLCQSIEDLHIPHIKSEVCRYVTISIGISIVKYEKNLKYIDIYKQADSYLYKAKEHGRNRVEYAILCP